MTTEPTEVRSGKSKRKPFNSNVAGHLLIIATFAFSYPLVLSGTSNICICAFAVVAPGVRFNAFAIFVAPALMQPEDPVHGA
jgi:Sec-independent protein secretion pathway component TatC